MEQSVSLPVRLQIENLQAIINELSSKLGNLKIGSKGFKDVQNVISSIQREIDKLQIQTSKPFMSQSQFNAAERSVSKLEDELERVQITMSRIKFSDLELNPGQLSQLKEFEAQIQQIKNSIKSVKETAKQEFLSGEGGAAWLGFSEKNAVAVNQTLAQITAAINAEFKKQAQAVDEAKAKLEEYKASMSLQGKIEDFTAQMSKVKSVQDTSKIFGSIYDKIFTASGSAFKAGGKTILAQWLTEQFQLDESTVQALVQESASKVVASLKNGELQALINSKLGTLQSGTAGTTSGALEADLAAKKARLDELQPALDGIAAANQSVGASEDALREKLLAVNTALEEFKNKETAAAASSADFASACTRGQAQLNNFKTVLAETNSKFLQLERTQRNFNAMKMTITNFMGFTQVLNLTKRAVREALNHIKELDTVMNKISIVTQMSTGDLWQQVDSYSAMAQKYGTSIKGAYEVSQIYYQQGLSTNEVLTLTNETLKAAKISGLDYASTTDYMTTALRGFKMEAADASTVVDVYSNLAAHTAVSFEELSVAMSKTASSLESVGVSFQEGSAMIGTMVAVTRESATNIGSALKSIAARYGEMKKDPLSLVDADGDALDYNKVDTALKSVGISLKDDTGQFRAMTDVILELSEVWDQLESTQQRYIATQFAGNRQQSRFLALVSNKDILKANIKYAEDSEDASDIQALKALDSIETKLEQVRVAYQQMYTTIGAEDIWKGALDGLKNFMDTLNHLPKLFGKIPIGAIAMIADVVTVIKDIGLRALGGLSKIWDKLLPDDMAASKGQQAGQAFAKAITDAINAAQAQLKEAGQTAANTVKEGADQAGRDENQPAGKIKQEKPTEGAIKPATTTAEDAVQKTEALSAAAATAASHTASIAKSMGEAADAADRAASAMAANPTVTPTSTSAPAPMESTPTLYIDDLKQKIQEQAQSLGLNEIEIQARLTLVDDLNTLDSGVLQQIQTAINNIDFSAPDWVEKFQAAIENIKSSCDAMGIDLTTAFKNAGDMGIAGLVQGLSSSGEATSLAGSIGQQIIAALKAGMGVASPSVPAHDAAQFVLIGAANGLEDSIGVATSKAAEAGTSIIAALKQTLEDSPLDLKSLIQFIPPDFDLDTADLSSLDNLKTQIQEKLESIKEIIANDPEGYAEAASAIAQPMIDRIKAVADADVKAQDKQLKSTSEYRALQAAKREVTAADERIAAGQSTLEKIQDPSYERKLMAEALLWRKDEDITPEERAAAQIKVQERLAKITKDANTSITEGTAAREVALKKQEAAQAAFDPLKAQRDAAVKQIREDQKTAEASVRETLAGGKRTQVGDTLAVAATPALAQVDTARENRATADAAAQAEEQKRQAEEQRKAAEEQRKAAEEAAYAEKVRKLTPEEEQQRAAEQAAQIAATTAANRQANEQEYLRRVGFSEERVGSMSDEERKAAISSSESYIRGLKKYDENLSYEDAEKMLAARMKATEGGEGQLLSGAWRDAMDKRAMDAEEGKISSSEILTPEMKGQVSISTTPDESSAQETGKKLTETVQETVSEKPAEVKAETPTVEKIDQSTIPKTPVSDVAEMRQGQSVEIPSDTKSEIDIINQKIAALERLKAAQDAVKNTEKGTQENTDAMAARRDAAAEARELGMENIRYNTSQSTLDTQIAQLKVQLDEASAQDAGQQAATEFKAEAESIPAEPQVDGSTAVAQTEDTANQIKASISQSVSSEPVAAPDMSAVEEAAETAAESMENAAERAKSAWSGMDFSDDAEIMEAMMSGDSLYGMYDGQSFNLNPDVKGVSTTQQAAEVAEQAAPIAPTVDTSLAVQAIQTLVDKLVEVGAISEEAGAKMKAGLESASPEELAAKMEELKASTQAVGDTAEVTGSKLSKINFSTLGSAVRMLANLTGISKQAKGAVMLLGGAITAIGVVIQMVDKASKTAAATNPWMAIAMAIMAVVNGISLLIETDEEKIERLSEAAEKASDKAKEAKSNYRSLTNQKEELEELADARYESAEAAEKYQDAVNSITEKFPELIGGFDSAGNAILDTTNYERLLESAREDTAAATLAAAKAERDLAKEKIKQKTGELTDTLQQITNLKIEKPEEAGQKKAGVVATTSQSKDGWILPNAYAEGMQVLYTIGEMAPSFNAESASKRQWTESNLANVATRLHDNGELYGGGINGAVTAAEMATTASTAGDWARLSEKYLYPNIVYADNGTSHVDLEAVYTQLEANKERLNECERTFFDYLTQLLGHQEAALDALEEVEMVDSTEAKDAIYKTSGVLAAYKHNNEIKSDIEMITLLKQDLANAIQTGDLEGIRYYYNLLKEFINMLPKDGYIMEQYGDQLNTIMGTVGELVGEYEDLIADDLSAEKAIMSAKLYNMRRADNNQLLTFMTERTELIPLLTKHLEEAFVNQDKYDKIEDFMDSDEAQKLAQAYDDFWLRYAGQFDADGNNMQEVLGRMLTDTRHYSAYDIINYLGLTEDDPLYKDLIDAYQANVNYIRTQLQNNLRQKSSNLSVSNKNTVAMDSLLNGINYSDIYSLIDQQYFNRIADEVGILSSKGLDTSAQTVATAGLAIWDSLQGVSEDTRNAVLDAVVENGIRTAEGVQAVIDAALEAGFDVDSDLITQLYQIKDILSNNLSLTIQAATEDFLNKWSDASKTMSKLTSGIDFTNVQAMIDEVEKFQPLEGQEKFTLTRADFKANGSKLVLTNEKAIEYWEAYSAQMDAQAQGWQDTLDAAAAGLMDESHETWDISSWNLDTNADQVIRWVESIIGDRWTNFIKQDENGKWIIEDEEGLIAALETGYSENQTAINNYRANLQYARDSIIKSAQWAIGNYSSLNDIYKDMEGYSELSEVDLAAAVTERLKTLVSGAEKMTSQELENPDIANAVKQIRSSYSNYISDLISKDINTLYAEDYVQTGRGKTQIANEMALAQDKTAQEFALWIASLSDAAGDAISTQNDNFIKAWEKVHSKESLDGVKDVQFFNDTFFGATTSQLKTFADTYQLKISDLVEQGIAVYDAAMDQWVVNYARLDELGLDLNAIPGFQATVQDSINSFFENLGKLITGAMEGTLSNADAEQLKQYAKDLGFEGDLTFDRTAKGLRLSNGLAYELYQTVKGIDAVQGHIVFDALYNSLVETDDRFKSVTAQAGYMAELTEDLNKQMNMKAISDNGGRVSLFDEMMTKGNVDLYNRPIVNNEDGSYSTLLTTTLDSRNFETDIPWIMNVTPIGPDGTVYEDNFVDEYIQGLIDKSDGSLEGILEADKQDLGLIIEYAEGVEDALAMDELAESMGDRAQVLHEISDAYESIRAGETYDDTKVQQYKDELALVQEIAAIRGTSEDSSYKFMEQNIPAGQNNPLNYWENWGKAYSAINDSISGGEGKTGYMGYQDFYNLVTQLGELSKLTGEAIPIGENIAVNSENVASLIEQAGAALEVTADGSLKINLSGIGVDFAASADEMAAGVDAGIATFAQAQIDMLDGLIKLMETIVAMEKLSEIDVDSDGIDLSDIFKVKYDEKGFELNEKYWDQFQDKFVEVAGKILKDAESDKELMKALQEVKVNGFSLHEMFQDALDGVKNLDIDAQAYTAVMQAFYKAAMSGDYDLDNIMTSVKDVLASTGFEGTIEIGNYKLTFQYGVVLEEGEDGKYHVGDKTFPKTDAGARAAARATAVDSLDSIKNATKEIDEETGEVKITSKVVSTIDYDVETHTYNINFVDEGYSATATSKAGADLAIQTYAKLTSKELDATDTNTTPVSFTLHQPGKVDVEITLENGEVTYKVVEGSEGEDNAEEVAAAAKAVADEKAAQAAAAAANTNGEAAIENMSVTLTGSIQATTPQMDVTLSEGGIVSFNQTTVALTNPILSATGEVQSLVLGQAPGFNVTGSDAIWEAAAATHQYDQFIGYVLSLILQQGKDFKAPDGSSIWDLISDKKDYDFVANVLSLITQEDPEGFTNDNGAAIWDYVKTNPAEAYKFVAYVYELSTQQDPNGFTNDNGDTIWSLVDGVSEKSGYSFIAWINTLKFMATLEAQNKAKSGPSSSDLGIQSVYTSENSIEFIQNVKLKYNVSTDEDAETIMNTRSFLYGDTYQPYNLPDQTHLHTYYTAEDQYKQLGLVKRMYSDPKATEGYGWYINDNSAITTYLDSLKNILATGEKLGAVDFANLEGLKNLDIKGEFGDQVNELYNAALTNEADAEEKFNSIKELLEEGIDVSNLEAVATAVDSIAASMTTLAEIPWATIAQGLNSLHIENSNNPSSNGEETPEIESGTTTVVVTYEADTTQYEADTEAAKAESVAEPATEEIEGDGSKAVQEGKDTKAAIDAMGAAITITANNSASSVISGIKRALDNLVNGGPYKVTVEARVTKTENSSAIGNIGLAKAAGTLMGELGPELVVSGGRYFVVGQSGPEMVNLADDAIVFNHLQTKSLLEKGTSSTRGRAITNEYTAASYAKGNINGGPAQASASAALNALKQLKAMWQSLLNASVKDLAGAGGGGGGGGGGDDGTEYGNFIKELEKWYNWLQKIAELEEEINYQEKLRSKIQSDMIPHGQDITKSYLTSLNALEDEVSVQQSLVDAQQEYFDSRREWMNSEKNPFSALYTFDKNGQLQYQDGVLEEFSYMIGSNEQGKANMNVKEQYEKLVEMGYGKYMKYDSEGSEIDFYKKNDDGTYELDDEGNKKEDEEAYTTAVEAFWAKVDADKEEMQSLHDSINEHRDAVLEKQEAMNEIMKNIEDNQISIENKVLKAVEDLHQRAIDDAKDERDAIEAASNELISGLSDQLQKERDIYADQQSADELAKLQRQLAILQRSGGSASQISSLESQIADQMQDAYFNAQQDQIDALQEAADAQLEKLDAQINLMEEQLAYEKEHGMLWNEVYTVMQGSPESIANYIKENDSSLWGESPTKTTQDYRDMLYEAQQYTEFRDNVEGGLDALVQRFTDTAGNSEAAAGTSNSGTTNTSASGESNGTESSANGSWKQNETGWWYEHSDGSYTKNNWENINDKWYRFDENGYMQTGWVQDNGKWYYLNSDGSMKTGWLQDNGKWYYLDESTGEMLADTTRELEWEGEKKHHVFGKDGAWINSYDKGGEIDTTGLALVHKHEGVLTEEQMNTLRNEIMGNKRNSLMNLLLDFRNAYEGLGSNSIAESNSSIVIEHAEVSMNVASIANDYDAERAGEMALEKMLQIARKSQGWNRVGR